jgi:glycosyltransferase involved in cell wall biosynthesis
MRLAFVIQRYGADVHGGAEAHCREWAERLASRHEVVVFTTCARDYLSWADHYAPGVETIKGVTVRRFPVDAPRDIVAFDAYSAEVFGQPHDEEREIEWMRRQGPYSTPLLTALQAAYDDFDRFVFITYLYATTFFGMPLVARKAVLVPTAHDEPPLRLGIFRRVFSTPRYIIYNTPSERVMLNQRFNIAHTPGSEVGVGVDVAPTMKPQSQRAIPNLLYIGRVHSSKNVEQLFAYFTSFRAENKLPLRLLFAGRADISMPSHPNVSYLGFISEDEKARLLDECALVVMPSAYESLSITCLEAWAAGRATLVNGESEVLRAQSLRSGGGLYYRTYDEFAAALDLLLRDAALRAQLGVQGYRFVAQNYSWPVVEARLEHALAEALAS